MMEKISGPVLFLTSVVYALWAAVFSRYIARQGREGEQFTIEAERAEYAKAVTMAARYTRRERSTLFPGTLFSRN